MMNKNKTTKGEGTDTMLKKVIAVLASAFILFLIIMTVVAYQHGAFASLKYKTQILEKNGTDNDTYDFVYCYHEPTGTTITYPEGTEC
jgi:preprotein translocase subunit SecG